MPASSRSAHVGHLQQHRNRQRPYLTYGLASGNGSTGNGSFTISGNQLLTNNAFNNAVQASYSVLVQMTDESGHSTTQVSTITVIALTGFSSPTQP